MIIRKKGCSLLACAIFMAAVSMPSHAWRGFGGGSGFAFGAHGGSAAWSHGSGVAYGPHGGSATSITYRFTQYYQCGPNWFRGFFGSNGAYYRVVPAPY